MKSKETKAQFIELRAEGLSYDEIRRKLHIAKATCCSWNKQFEKEIAQREQERLQDLYSLYGMSKAARVERLGRTLELINNALDTWNISCMTPEQLLNAKLKYEKALRDEYENGK